MVEKELIWEQLRFLKDHIESILKIPDISYQSLSASLVIPTAKGFQNAADCYVPSFKELFELHPGKNVHYVDSWYTTTQDVSQWNTFLLKLGVNFVLKVCIRMNGSQEASKELQSLWGRLSSQWNKLEVFLTKMDEMWPMYKENGTEQTVAHLMKNGQVLYVDSILE